MALEEALVKSLVLATLVPEEVGTLIVNIAEEIANGMEHEEVQRATEMANDFINTMSEGHPVERMEDMPTANKMAV